MWSVFAESFSTAVGMGVGMSPNRFVASAMAQMCDVKTSPEFWMLFGDLERTWVTYANERKPDDE